jgi:hypothetical protein
MRIQVGLNEDAMNLLVQITLEKVLVTLLKSLLVFGLRIAVDGIVIALKLQLLCYLEVV